MPTYIYQHPQSKEIIEVSQKISDTHEYTDEKGVKWNRVFTVPNASIPNLTRIDAGSEEDFMKKTQGSGGTVGDLFDMSAELSQKRQQDQGTGTDPVKQKFFKDYSSKRNGLKHRDDTSHLDPKYKPDAQGNIEI